MVVELQCSSLRYVFQWERVLIDQCWSSMNTKCFNQPQSGNSATKKLTLARRGRLSHFPNVINMNNYKTKIYSLF